MCVLVCKILSPLAGGRCFLCWASSEVWGVTRHGGPERILWKPSATWGKTRESLAVPSHWLILECRLRCGQSGWRSPYTSWLRASCTTEAFMSTAEVPSLIPGASTHFSGQAWYWLKTWPLAGVCFLRLNCCLSWERMGELCLWQSMLFALGRLDHHKLA